MKIFSFFPFSFSTIKKKENQQLIYTFFFTNTKECGRSGAESIWSFAFSLQLSSCFYKFYINYHIYLLCAESDASHDAGTVHRLKPSHMLKNLHFHRRHLVTAICIVAGIQLASMAAFIDVCIHVYIRRIAAV